MSTSHIERALDRAIALAGGQSKLARAVGYTQNAIWSARARGRVTAELAIRIESALGGRVTREQLAPQVFKLSKLIAPIDVVSDDEPVT